MARYTETTPADSDIHNDGEIWKTIPDFPDYEASNLGRIRSLPRVRTDEGGRNGATRHRHIPGVILRPSLNHGYPHVALTVDSIGHTRPVHRLVLEAFVGPRPDGMECRHLDGNRENAALSNLVWGTPSENQNDRAEHGTSNIGEQHPLSKLSELDVIEILWRHEAGYDQTELAEMFEVSRSAVGQIVSCERWQHVMPFRCTYCMDDDKLRIYSGYRFADSVKAAIKDAGFRWAPKQECWFTHWSIKAEDICLQISGSIEDEDISPEERAADRAERFAGYRDKRRAEASGFADRFEAGPDAHGYQNAARAERAAARHDRQRDKALCQWSKAEYWQTRTAGVIAHALHRSDAATRRGRILEIERLLRTYATGRYAEHLQMRLIYENGMLENEGGKAAEVEIVPGGWINSKVCRRHMGQLIEVDGWSQIVKVNKSNTTGRVVSVVCMGRDRFGWGSAEKQEKVREIKVNIERHGEDVYRAPTPEELEAFNKKQTARKERAKATAPAKPPLINPTMEDAQKLQDALNAQAPKEKPAAVRVMTQTEYSAQSKGAYARFETIGITERLRKSWKNASGRDVGGRFVVFQVRSAGFMPAQVIVLSDKPQKSIPWDAVADAVAQIPTREDVVSRLHLIEHVPAWYHDYTPEQVQALDDARYYGLGYMDSLSQFGITQAGLDALKAYRETQAAPAPAAEPAPVGCLF